MARRFVLPVRVGYKHVPVLCRSPFALPQLQRVGCLSRNMRRWTQTATSPPHYGKFRVSCNHYGNCVTRKGGLIACSACTEHGQWHLPAGSTVATGGGHTCAVRADGRLICFGWNNEGQCDVPADLGPVLAVAAGAGHTCAVRADGQLICFGWNEKGLCDVPADLGPVLAVAAGQFHTCAVRADGRLICFGWNNEGQCDVPADLGPVLGVTACRQMVGSSVLDGTRMGSAMCQQIWDQFWQSQLALVTRVLCGQMVSSPVLDGMRKGCVMYQQIWDQFWQSQLAVVKLAQCGQMVSSFVLDAMAEMGSVTSHQIWDQFSGSLSYLCCAEGTDGQLVCYGDNFYGKSHVPR